MGAGKQGRVLVYPLGPVLMAGLLGYFLAGRPLGDGAWWLLAVLLYGLGDGLTTWVGVRRTDVEEGMPFVRRLLGANPGLAGLFLVKLVGLGALYGGYVLLSSNPFRDIIPVGLTIWGVFAVASNVRTLVGSLRAR